MENDSYADFIIALEELRTAIHGLHLSSLEARDALAKVINDGHLKSTLTLLRQDIALRRTLDLVK